MRPRKVQDFRNPPDLMILRNDLFEIKAIEQLPLDGPVLTVKFKDGGPEKKLIVGPNVPVSRLQLADRSELKSGAAVAAAAATKQPDGTFTAARIDVGRGDVVP